MTRLILASLLFMQVGCAEYMAVTGGVLTGRIAHDIYTKYIDDKDKEDKQDD